jgi:hypothetical protein
MKLQISLVALCAAFIVSALPNSARAADNNCIESLETEWFATVDHFQDFHLVRCMHLSLYGKTYFIPLKRIKNSLYEANVLDNGTGDRWNFEVEVSPGRTEDAVGMPKEDWDRVRVVAETVIFRGTLPEQYSDPLGGTSWLLTAVAGNTSLRPSFQARYPEMAESPFVGDRNDYPGDLRKWFILTRAGDGDFTTLGSADRHFYAMQITGSDDQGFLAALPPGNDLFDRAMATSSDEEYAFNLQSVSSPSQEVAEQLAQNQRDALAAAAKLAPARGNLLRRYRRLPDVTGHSYSGVEYWRFGSDIYYFNGDVIVRHEHV